MNLLTRSRLDAYRMLDRLFGKTKARESMRKIIRNKPCDPVEKAKRIVKWVEERNELIHVLQKRMWQDMTAKEQIEGASIMAAIDASYDEKEVFENTLYMRNKCVIAMAEEAAQQEKSYYEQMKEQIKAQLRGWL